MEWEINDIPKSKTTGQKGTVRMINLCDAARELRTRLGLSVRKAADELGISFVHLSNIENDKVSPSPEIIDRFRQTWGIDLYMYAVCKFSDLNEFPERVARPLERLKGAWEREIDELIQRRSREASRNAEFVHD
jgi:transcriptional regulator with XRE-family HTH domain